MLNKPMNRSKLHTRQESRTTPLAKEPDNEVDGNKKLERYRTNDLAGAAQPADLISTHLCVTYLISERATQASGPLEKHTKIAKKQLLITQLTINRIALFL
jgi:hypothetical protein